LGLHHFLQLASALSHKRQKRFHSQIPADWNRTKKQIRAPPPKKEKKRKTRKGEKQPREKERVKEKKGSV
jgi:hypothetical protein